MCFHSWLFFLFPRAKMAAICLPLLLEQLRFRHQASSLSIWSKMTRDAGIHFFVIKIYNIKTITHYFIISSGITESRITLV